jgi:predicted transcriptional regulator
MSGSVAEQLRRDADCEALLARVHGLTALDREVFRALVASADPLAVDDLAARVDRERSTAYRSVQRLLDAGLARKEQVNYDQGGYYHVYRPTDPDAVADDIQRLLDDWYARMERLVQEFRDEYGGRVQESAASEE